MKLRVSTSQKDAKEFKKLVRENGCLIGSFVSPTAFLTEDADEDKLYEYEQMVEEFCENIEVWFEYVD